MDIKSRTKIMADRVFGWIKPFMLAGLVLLFLQATGLFTVVTYAAQWTLLQTGLGDADDEIVDEAATFSYDFTIKDLEGNRIPFETFKGKVIFLNLWATWCGPCRAEMPGIQGLYEKVDKDKVVFIMLSLDKDADQPKVASYLKNKSFTFNAYMPSGYLPEQLQVPSIPTTFVISAEGKIVKKEVGAMQYDTPDFLRFLGKLSN
ncbi:MAG: TlpA family protein disulfide reductase [Cyclobacteriaceae bacterium]|nr:TlpA family protein disulfide reductase [Cyclobacteriaceae bacterium]